jgi:asparagine synthase (glutamine-hydrolysing)
MFSSEIRGLLDFLSARRVEQAAMPLFSALGYVPGEKTLVKGIFKLSAGQMLIWNFNDMSHSVDWFGRRMTASGVFDHATIRSRFGASIRAHTTGLRPFGLYLSGGLDSTIILHELAQQQGTKAVRTYTTRFDIDTTEYSFNDDADIAQKLCHDYNIEHHELIVTDEAFTDATEEAIIGIEEPRYSPSLGAYWMLAQKASRDVVVVLSGSGGDELFLGYPKYLRAQGIDAKVSLLPSVVSNIIANIRFWQRGRLPFGRMINMNNALDRWAIVSALGKMQYNVLIDAMASIGYPAIQNPLSDIQNAIGEIDRVSWLADEEFLRTDKVAMHFGMEGRFPMMASSIIEMANSIPSRDKIVHGVGKSILRSAYDGHLPSYVTKKKKTGWKAPVAPWMNGRFGEFARAALSVDYYNGLGGMILLGDVQSHAQSREHTTVSLKRIMPTVAFQVWARANRITS